MQNYKQLRFYSYTNFYISSIQHGIQTGHASVDLLQKYRREFDNAINSENDSEKVNRIAKARDNLAVVTDWADNHKTYVVLNGGDDIGITQINDLVSKTGFPFIDFKEPGLGNIRTCVGIILPDEIFTMKRTFVKTEWQPDGFQIFKSESTDKTVYQSDELYSFLQFHTSCGLAR